MADPLLIVQDLGFAWPDGRRLFDHLNFSLGPGLNWLQGDDGSGKSTLLALTAGALPTSQGRLCAAGHWYHENPDAYRAQVFRIDPQTEAHDATPAASYLEGLAHHWPHLSASALSDLVDGFDLSAHLHKPLYMLSTGSRRKVWLTAALASGAPLTLLDQPFAALDATSTGFLIEVLQDLADHPSRAWWVADHSVESRLAPRMVVSLD
ncbi:MAG: ATP-binding cassette domain-containing protein [Hydrogenophaga sp.]|uniref:ABC transporter ATP-binding protein n=1 Tax=Hydrogenophaga sp. TaxID=1904254 RepID=UPI001D87D357|nr:ATP-binding cassette domain-containing protein [Hydrogenophaga sp.]MBX3611496.1 ATP-binding cassette domain-containing protein [Hydrogenophaga sp.]